MFRRVAASVAGRLASAVPRRSIRADAGPKRARQKFATTLMKYPNKALIVFSSLVSGVIVFLFLLDLSNQYQAALDDAHRATRKFSEILAEHTARSFEAIDRTLREAVSIRDDLREGNYKATEEANAALRRLRQTSTILVALGWTNASGDLEAHSYPNDPPRPNIADLPHFVVHREQAANELFIAAPFRSVATGQWISAVSRRLKNSDGSFAGVVVAPLDLSYFTGIYRTIKLGDHGTVVLRHRVSRTVLVREPYQEDVYAKSFVGQSSRFERAVDADAGSYETVSIVDGQDRIVGYKTVPGLPLMILATMARADVLEPWYDHLRITGPMILLLLASIVAGTILLLKQMRVAAEQADALAVTLDNIDQGLALVGADGRVAVYNRRILELLDVPAELAATRPHFEQVIALLRERGEFPPEDKGMRKFIKPAVHDATPALYERERPNGTILEVRTAALPNGGAVRTYSDVTVRRATKAALLEAKERAEAAARAKSDFLATMSHELRTPLTAIIGASEALLGGSPSPERRRRYLEMQRDAGKGLLAIINDILDFSKIDSGHVEIESAPFSPGEVARSCVSLMLDEATKKGLDLSVEVSAEVPDCVSGDGMRLRQVLLNLLSNAVKFTEAGSVRLEVKGDAVADGMTFSISDTGIGIEQSRIAALFDRFTQADNSTTRRYGGTGLGLAISKALVELMGGTLEVQSTPGKGSDFFFTLRLQSADPSQLRPTTWSNPRPGVSHRILLAEDNETSRELITAMLERAGHMVIGVADGLQAVEAAAKDKFDAILMDVQMPKMDGYAAARMIRRNVDGSGFSPIVALTANALSDEAERCREAGMDAHVPKPVDWDLLFATIDRLAGSRQNNLIAQPSTGDRRRRTGEEGNTDRVLDGAKLDQLRERVGKQNVMKLLALLKIEASERFRTEPISTDLHPLVAEEAHSFAGAAGMLGFDELTDACRALEAAVAEGQAVDIAVDRCRVARDRAVAKIETLIAAGEFENEADVRRSSAATG